jgi:hypothetical protein
MTRSLDKGEMMLAGCEHAIRGSCMGCVPYVCVALMTSKEVKMDRMNRPPEVSCLYSVMSRLSAVALEDVREAI